MLHVPLQAAGTIEGIRQAEKKLGQFPEAYRASGVNFLVVLSQDHAIMPNLLASHRMVEAQAACRASRVGVGWSVARQVRTGVAVGEVGERRRGKSVLQAESDG